MTKELRYNLLFALLLMLIGETWELSVRAIFSSRSILDGIQLKGFLLFLTFNIAYFTVYALNYLVFAPRFLKVNKIPHYIGAFLIMVLCFAAVRFFLEEVVGFALFGAHNYNLERDNIVAVYLMDSTGYALRPCLFSSLMYLFFRYKENMELVNTLKLQQQKAQMSMLQSQIGPHFLFNTLNGFYSDLYDDKPNIANDLLKLSKLLRYITYEVNESYMPLSKELDFIKNYLYFYEKRYEDQFFVSFKVEGTIDDRKIPSLVMIHFVENVCKHGVIDQKEKPAFIEIVVGEESLTVSTRNSVNSSEKYMDKGIGTQNVKNRLDILFNDGYELTYGVQDDEFQTYLKIPV